MSFVLETGNVSIYSKALFFLSDSKAEVPNKMDDIRIIIQRNKTIISR
jgi:hypothetical protein